MINGFDRALIIKKIHLDKILSGEKIWEMRSSKTKISGKIGLIESGSGLIIGECYLIGCEEALTLETAKTNINKHCVDNLSLLEKWKYPWLVSSPVLYDNPIPYIHPKGAVIWVKV
jgi:hypothetical protein